MRAAEEKYAAECRTEDDDLADELTVKNVLEDSLVEEGDEGE